MFYGDEVGFYNVVIHPKDGDRIENCEEPDHLGEV